MKTLQLREVDSEVYYLTSDGFKKGKIKSVLVDQYTLEVTYRVIHSGQASVYMGDERKPEQVWTRYGDMIQYYTDNKQL